MSPFVAEAHGVVGPLVRDEVPRCLVVRHVRHRVAKCDIEDVGRVEDGRRRRDGVLVGCEARVEDGLRELDREGRVVDAGQGGVACGGEGKEQLPVAGAD